MEVDEIIIISESDESQEHISASDSDVSFKSLDGFETGALARSQETIFQCPRCSRMFSDENGIVLKACKHWMCKECVIDYYFKNQKFAMTCEYKSNVGVCGKNISENEIRSVLNEVGMNQLDETIVRHSQYYHSV